MAARGSRRRERDIADEENEATTVLQRRKLEVDVESRIIYSPSTNRGGNYAGASETSVVVIIRRRDSPVEEEEEEECQIQIPSSEYDIDRVSVSCCSSNNNRSQEKSKRRIEFVDFEVKDNGENQTEASWIYDNVNTSEESVNMEEEVESRRRLKMEKKTVKEGELEGFFQEAEKDLRGKILESTKKYNFDFEKEEPLGGRYEWVKLNP